MFISLISVVNESSAQTSERDLLRAVLERSIRDYLGSNKKERQEAAEWIFDEDEDSIHNEFSFSWVCLQLGLSADATREKVSKMTPRGNIPAQKWWRFAAHGS